MQCNDFFIQGDEACPIVVPNGKDAGCHDQESLWKSYFIRSVEGKSSSGRIRHRARGEIAGGLKPDHQCDAGDHEEEVHLRHVDLATHVGVGVNDLQTRQVAKLHRLLGERINTRDHGLRSDDGGRSCQDDHRHQQRLRHQFEERVLQRFRIADDESSLAEVIQNERGIDEYEPGALQRLRAEVADVRIQRFTTRDGQQHHAHDDDAVVAMVHQVINAPVRRQGHYDFWMIDEAIESQSGQ